jgi:hypothetical protein
MAISSFIISGGGGCVVVDNLVDGVGGVDCVGGSDVEVEVDLMVGDDGVGSEASCISFLPNKSNILSVSSLEISNSSMGSF